MNAAARTAAQNAPCAPATLAATAGLGARTERVLLILLAAMQFTHVLDFVIVMPLGPTLMRAFGLTPAQFGFVVSAYTFSAAAAGIAGAFFIDRFDRRDALLAVYCGFVIGTLACALSTGFYGLLAARAVAGAFGGLVQAIVFAIVGDVFVEARRGAATGTVMSAFSFASVFGVPLGLWLASRFGWQAPFAFLAAAGAFVFAVAWRAAPELANDVASHVHAHVYKRERRRSRLPPSERPRRFEALRFAFSDWNRARAFWLTIALMFAGFTVLPYMSPYLVSNVGVDPADLHYVYLLGGGCCMFTSRWFGRVADRFGKFATFAALACGSAASILALTHLPRAPLPVALLATTAFTVLLSGRSIPAMAMITSSVARARRASFLTLTSAVQQLSSGAAALAGGLFLSQSPEGSLVGFGRAGCFAAAATAASILIARRLKPAVEGER